MDTTFSALGYLTRAKALHKSGDQASLVYAALELRCGVEARLREHAAVANGVSKNEATAWNVKKLAKTIDRAFGLGDSLLVVFLEIEDGRACQFMYAPVSSRLQDIAMRCGDYLHAVPIERVQHPRFWVDLKALVREGCNLLDLACSSEVVRPSTGYGWHFSLPDNDPRIAILEAYQGGMRGKFSVATFTPTAPMTIYSADE